MVSFGLIAIIIIIGLTLLVAGLVVYFILRSMKKKDREDILDENQSD